MRYWLPLALLAVTTVAAVVFAVHYYTLRSQMAQACGGVIATLDLSEMAPLCREVM